MSNTVFNINVLDPDSYKASLIAALKNNPVYSGYNFGGSNFNVLFDVLSRNTYLKAYYYNMIHSEGFLDSAILRDSAVSRAKELNYTPQSVTSSKTTVDLNISTANLTVFEIPKGTRFSGQNSNGSFVFTTDDVYIQTSGTGNYLFSNVRVFEGTYTTDLFTIDYSVPNQTFTLSNPSIDISSISTTVDQNDGKGNTIFTKAANIFDINGNSNIYYLQGASANQYQIYFGDNVLGNKPSDGSVVSATYRVSFGSNANYIGSLSLLDNLGAFNGGSINTFSISMNDITSGGANNESTSSIKFNAPKAYQTQGSAVVSGDYKFLVMTAFPNIGDMYVYNGGLTANSILYGTVIMAAVTKQGNPLTQSIKNQVLSYISNLDVIQVSTAIVDATTLYIDVSSNVHVNYNVTNNSPNYYQTQISNTILNYSSNNIQKFNTPFRLSPLTTSISNIDPTAIISNETTIQLKRAIPLILNTNNNIVTSFNNPIESIYSDSFVVNGNITYLSDSNGNNVSNGSIYIISKTSSNNILSQSIIGSVNYDSGNISINQFSINQFLSNNSQLFIHAVPQNEDIYCNFNDILKIDNVTVNAANG